MRKTSKRTSASRKRSPALPKQLLRVLSAIDQVVKSAGGRWYLFGAQAVGLHGAPRTTKDIDVTVLLGDGDSSTLLDAIRAGGFTTRVDKGFLESSRVIPAKHRTTEQLVDFVLGGPGLEQHFLDSAVTLSLPGVRVPLIRLEHLLVLKSLAARARDLEDLRRLLRRRKDVDLEEVRQLIRHLQADIGDSTVLPVFEGVVEEISLSSNHRPAKRLPRG